MRLGGRLCVEIQALEADYDALRARRRLTEARRVRRSLTAARSLFLKLETRLEERAVNQGPAGCAAGVGGRSAAMTMITAMLGSMITTMFGSMITTMFGSTITTMLGSMIDGYARVHDHHDARLGDHDDARRGYPGDARRGRSPLDPMSGRLRGCV